MTETLGTFTGHSAEDYEQPAGQLRPAAAGLRAEDRATRDGARAAAGEVGELWAKGPSVVKGYWNKPEATAETFVDGWVRTGDLARLDEEGFFFIIDRAKDMLIRGGENIYCIEVENVLYEHPGGDGRRRGRHPAPDAGRGAGRGGHPEARRRRPREEELRAFVAERLAAFKVPVEDRLLAARCCRATPTARSSRPS